MIVISFTTIPERLEKGLPEICINSLLEQSIKPDYIIVNIPEISKKGQKYSEFKAKKLELLSDAVRVQFGIKDQGPITKLVPTLDFIKKKKIEKALIILVDDDCVYNKFMIENLITTKKKYPDELVIGTAGRIKQHNKLEHIGVSGYNNNTITDHIYVDIIETFAGVLYDYDLFKETDFVEWLSEFPDFVMLADDIILSFWSKKQGVKLYKIIQNVPELVKHNPMKTTELNIINDNGGNNEMVYDFFEDYFEKEHMLKLIVNSKNNSFAEFVNNN
jgi:hypothetical protein